MLVASLPTRLTDTGEEVFHPLSPFAVCDTVSVGLTVSILSASRRSSVPLPALSFTEQATACVPSPDTLTDHGEPEPDTVAGLPSTVQVGVAARSLVASLAATLTDTGEEV